MTDTQTGDVETRTNSLVPRLTSDVIVANLQRLIDALPEAEDGDELAVVARILEAQRAEDLDRPWTASGLELFMNTEIQINGVRRRPSDFTEGMGIYLVLDIVSLDTGETATVTTGSTSVVAQVAMAVQLIGLPFVCTPRTAERKTRAGYYPHHLERVHSPLT